MNYLKDPSNRIKIIIISFILIILTSEIIDQTRSWIRDSAQENRTLEKNLQNLYRRIKTPDQQIKILNQKQAHFKKAIGNIPRGDQGSKSQEILKRLFALAQKSGIESISQPRTYGSSTFPEITIDDIPPYNMIPIRWDGSLSPPDAMMLVLLIESLPYPYKLEQMKLKKSSEKIRYKEDGKRQE